MRPDLKHPRRPDTPRLAREALHAFGRIDNRRAVASLAFDYGVVLAAATMAAWAHRTPVTILALVVIAGRQCALQGLVHSACHYSLFSKRRHNDALEFLFAYPLLDSVPLYREQHLEHHRAFRLRTPDRFDYLHETLQLSRQGIWIRTWVVFIRPLLGHAGFAFLSDVGCTFKENRQQARKLIAYWAVVLAAAWLTGCLGELLLYWIVPLLWLYPVLDIWAELSDHLDARGDSRNQEGFFYGFLLKGHETYHAVHHWYPFVPYYRLRDLHERLREQGVVMEDSRGPLDFVRIVYGSAGRVPQSVAVLGVRP